MKYLILAAALLASGCTILPKHPCGLQQTVVYTYPSTGAGYTTECLDP